MGKLSMAIAVLVLATFSALAQDNRGGQIRATLTGFQEVPAIATRGAGEFTAEIDPNGTQIKYTLRWENLEGGAIVGAHIHIGQPGVNGAIVVNLCKPACTISPLSSTIVATDVLAAPAQGIAAGEIADLLRALRAGVTYVNMHTAVFTSGEIRGQIRSGRGPQNERGDDVDDDSPGRGRGRGRGPR